MSQVKDLITKFLDDLKALAPKSAGTLMIHDLPPSAIPEPRRHEIVGNPPHVALSARYQDRWFRVHLFAEKQGPATPEDVLRHFGLESKEGADGSA